MSSHSRSLLKAGPRDGFYSFISYSTRDDEAKKCKDLVDGYVSAMKKQLDYIPVFIDRFWIPEGGPGLANELESALDSSDFTTAFLSPGYVSSPWCAFEWGYARCLSQFAAQDRKRHAILPICWKRFDRDHEGALVIHPGTIDVSADIEAGRHVEAIQAAVSGSVQFIRSLYGGVDKVDQE